MNDFFNIKIILVILYKNKMNMYIIYWYKDNRNDELDLVY